MCCNICKDTGVVKKKQGDCILKNFCSCDEGKRQFKAARNRAINCPICKGDGRYPTQKGRNWKKCPHCKHINPPKKSK